MKQLNEYLSTKVKLSKIVATDDNIGKIVQDEVKRLGKDADLNHIDVSNVTDFSYCFFQTLFNGDISGWDVSKGKIFDFMFSANQIFNGYLGNWNVVSAESMASMFNYADEYRGEGLENWSTKLGKCVDFQYMFQHCLIDGKSISSWKISPKVEQTQFMFNDCLNLECDLSGWIIPRKANFHHMLYKCPKMSPVNYPKYIPNRKYSID